MMTTTAAPAATGFNYSCAFTQAPSRSVVESPALGIIPFRDASTESMPELERRLLADDLALVPWLAMNSVGNGSHDGLPSS